MYCNNCGNKNIGNNFCTRCGNRLSVVNSSVAIKKSSDNDGMKAASIVLGIISIVGSIMIVLSPISIILSIIGLILGIVSTKKGKNVLGIVLNSIGLFISIVVILIIVFLFGIFTTDGYEEDFYGNSYDYRNFMDDIDDEYY